MDSFLKQFAQDIASRFESPKDICIVLPTKRAVTFLKQELAEAYKKTFWAPQFYSLGEFVEQLSDYKKDERLILVLELYEAYLSVVKEEPEDLGSFLKWAPTLLADFAEIDRYLIEPRNIFNYINEARALEYWNVNGEPLTDAQKHYLHFWKLLGEIYHAFNKQLSLKGKAYAGMQFREVAQQIVELESKIEYSKVIFSGFNALSAAEEKIVYTLVKSGKAEIFWDADDYYLKPKEQEAGRFMRRIIKKYPNIPFRWSGNGIASQAKEINIVACNTDSAQTHYAGSVLQEVFNERKATRTAVILNNEDLLLPLLYNLPQNINAANITMGYSLKLSPLTTFVNSCLDCWSNYRGIDENKAFYFKSVFKVIEHPYFSHLAADYKTEIQTLKQELVKKNVIYVGINRFNSHFGDAPFVGLLFNKLTDTHNLVEILLKILSLLKLGISNAKLSDIEKSIQTEYLYTYTVIFRKFLRLVEESKHLKKIPIKIFKKLLHQLVSSESLSFFGEPLKGLQIMGMLETRLLDFERIIMLSVNEGVLPQGKKDNSFIPYDIKREFGLPTHHDHDAVFANHFYRLLHKVKKLDLVYLNGQNDFGASTERSRFIEQLNFELPLINKQVKINELSHSPSPELKDLEIDFEKNEKSIELIIQKLEKGISPSALNKFIACSLDFYYRYILKLGEADEVEESLKHSTFGTCVHNTLEILFEPYLKKNLLTLDIKSMEKKVLKILTDQFLQHLSKEDLMTGNNLLIFEVAQQYVRNFLAFEIKNIVESQAKQQEYIVVSQEEKIHWTIPVIIEGKTIKVKVEGFADRIGLVGDQLQLVDYKTGNVTNTELGFKTWDELAEKPIKSKAFQLALYGYVYLMQNPDMNDFVAGIYSFRNLKSGLLQLTWNRKVVTANDLRENFPYVIEKIVHKMVGSSNKFEHNPDAKYCNYC